MRSVVVSIGKALGKAVIAGVGVELARLASGHLHKRFGASRDDDNKAHDELARVRDENAKLRAEVEQLRQQGTNRA